jgi:hypothetical protein
VKGRAHGESFEEGFAIVQAVTVTGCASLLGWLALWGVAAEVAVSHDQSFCRRVAIAMKSQLALFVDVQNKQAAAHADL